MKGLYNSFIRHIFAYTGLSKRVSSSVKKETEIHCMSTLTQTHLLHVTARVELSCLNVCKKTSNKENSTPALNKTFSCLHNNHVT